jgi:hypothetical protein
MATCAVEDARELRLLAPAPCPRPALLKGGLLFPGSIESECGLSQAPQPGAKPYTALKIAGGFCLLAIGLVLAVPGVPGPGILLILVGLLLLQNHFAWAKRSLEWMKRKTDAIRGRAPH